MRGKPRIIRNKMLAKANNASPKGAFRLSAAERKKYNRMTDKEDKMNLRIALAGNPNCGKTTLFNALTGSNQFVGNWPGVTVEKKEGKLKKHDGVIITDLPGIYSLSPYTLEEVVARNYLIGERPDAILNIIDGTNLGAQPVSYNSAYRAWYSGCCCNQHDGPCSARTATKSMLPNFRAQLGCKVVEISALQAEPALRKLRKRQSMQQRTAKPFPCTPSRALLNMRLHISRKQPFTVLPEEQQRWYAMKIFERDDKVLEKLNIDPKVMEHINKDIEAVEKEMDDDSESIITNERYIYIGSDYQELATKRKTRASFQLPTRLTRS